MGLPGPESYLIPFGLQWAPIVPIIVLLFFAPDSPYWLIRRERFDDAVKTLGRLHTPTEAVHDAKLVDEIRETVRMEQQLKTGGSYAACLSKRNIRRTEISTVGWASQGLVGYVVQFFATYFFVRAGMPTQQAFSLGLGNYLIAGAGTVTSWFLQAYFGRRSITIVGLCYMMVFMLLVGILDFVDTDAGRWAQSICLMVRSRSARPSLRPLTPSAGLVLWLRLHFWADCLRHRQRVAVCHPARQDHGECFASRRRVATHRG